MAEEEWRPIPGFEFYEASSLGRIRSLDRVLEFDGRWGVTRRRQRGKVLAKRAKKNRDGAVYHAVYLGFGRRDEALYRQTNRLVCLAFHGEPPSDRHEAAHLDGNSLDDRAANIAWVTPVENAAHKRAHGTHPAGEKNGASILTDADIPLIFAAYAGGAVSEEVGAAFGTSYSNVMMIVARRHWAHVAVDPELVAAAQAMAKSNITRVHARAS